MKNITSGYKGQIKLLGREIDSKVIYEINGDTIELGAEELNSITPSFKASLLKTTMKELQIDSNVEIPLETILNYQFGLKVNGEYEYIDFGNYVVKEVEKQEDTNSWIITCYDKMLYSMKDYETFNITYPCTIRNYITALCNKLDITFANENDEFCNYDKEIANELFIAEDGNSLGFTFRDVLDQLAEVTGSIICINDDDELEIRYPNETNDTIDEYYLKDINVKFGEKFGPVNSIVLSRAGDSDSIYLSDDESIELNGLTEIKISENQFMNFNDRDQYLPDLLETLDGLEFYINDFSSTGITYYDIYDKYNISIDGNTYNCLMLNDTLEVTQGLSEDIYTDLPEKTETDYKKSDKTDNKINQTWIIANKQTGEIEALTSRVTEVEANTVDTYTKEQINDLIQTAETGLTNTFINSGGNNIFRNTGLWFEQRSEENKYSYNISGSGLGISYNFNRDTITLNGTTTDSGIIADLTTETLLIPAGEYTFTSTNLSGKFIRNNRDTAIYFRNLNNQTVISILGENNYEKNATLVFNEDTLLHPMLYANGSGMVFENLTISLKIVENNLYYEFWNGLVERISEEKAINRNALLLKQGTLEQEQQVPNGNYTVSFNYEKLVELATVRVIINGVGYELSEMEDTEFEQTIQVSTQNIDVQFVSDTDDSCKVYDLMVNKGDTKATYTQNQNETTTDTVNISKGITITSSEVDTTFKANADGVRIYANSDMENPKTWFTEKGTTTENLIVNEEAQITGLLHRRVGDHVWVTKI